MLGRSIFDFVSRGLQSKPEAYQRKLSGSRPLFPSARLLRSDGRRLTLEIHDVLIQDNRGVATGMRSVLVDVTGRKQTEDAFARERGNPPRVCTSALSAIVMIDGEGRAILGTRRPSGSSLHGR